VDAGQADPRRLDLARLVDAGGDQHRGMALAQLGDGRIAPDLEFQVEGDAGLAQQIGAPGDHVLFQLEVGDAVDQQAADPVVAVVDMHPIALAAQLLRRRQAGRSGADDADRLGALDDRRDRPHPPLAPGRLGQIGFHGANRDGAVAGPLDDAIALAQAVVRADAAADLREIVGGLGQLVGLLQAAGGGEHQPVGDVVVQRAMHLTERHAALRAAASLLGGRRGREGAIDFIEIGAARFDGPLFRGFPGQIHESEHLGDHSTGSPLSLRWYDGVRGTRR